MRKIIVFLSYADNKMYFYGSYTALFEDQDTGINRFALVGWKDRSKPFKAPNGLIWQEWLRTSGNVRRREWK